MRDFTKHIDFTLDVAKDLITNNEPILLGAYFIDSKNEFVDVDVDEDGKPLIYISKYYEHGRPIIDRFIDDINEICKIEIFDISNVIIVYESWMVDNDKIIKNLEVRKHNTKKEYLNINIGHRDGSSYMKVYEIIRNYNIISDDDIILNPEFEGNWIRVENLIKPW